MIKLENFEVMGWEHAIRGMRNPKNSWERSDSRYCIEYDHPPIEGSCVYCEHNDTCDKTTFDMYDTYIVGSNDHELMMKLAKGGPVHAKYRRMIAVYVDITAPLYWWKEFDTYKVGTVANSCSTMHKIHEKPFNANDISCDELMKGNLVDTDGNILAPELKAHYKHMMDILSSLNNLRDLYLKTGDKRYWRCMIEMLPSSYNQKRTVMLNYEVLAGIYPMRKNHKLDEWREFCTWIESLPYSEIITCGANKIIEVDIKVETPEYFAENLINIRNATNATIISEYKGIQYAACDGVTAEDIVDAINQEMNTSSEASPDAGDINESGLLSE